MSSTTPPPVSMAITSATPPAGKAGMPYDGSGFSFSASGGVAPYRWNWAAQPNSSLPVGLSLSNDGVISGMPRAAGTYNVLVTVQDAGIPPAQVRAKYPINIDGGVTLAITSGPPPSGTVGVDYGPAVTRYFSCVLSPVLGWHLVCTQCSSFAACSTLPPCQGLIPGRRCRQTRVMFLGYTFTAVGGVPPYAWSASGLPPQLTLDPNSGQLTGTATTAGSFSATITVTDAQSPSAQASANYMVDVTDAMTP
jgi:hypothetical protein